MIGQVKTWVFAAILQGFNREAWVVDVLLPSLFTMLLLGCLVHLGYCVLKAQLEPVVRFHYAISAFPM